MNSWWDEHLQTENCKGTLQYFERPTYFRSSETDEMYVSSSDKVS